MLKAWINTSSRTININVFVIKEPAICFFNFLVLLYDLLGGLLWRTRGSKLLLYDIVSFDLYSVFPFSGYTDLNSANFSFKEIIIIFSAILMYIFLPNFKNQMIYQQTKEEDCGDKVYQADLMCLHRYAFNCKPNWTKLGKFAAWANSKAWNSNHLWFFEPCIKGEKSSQ